MITASDFKPGTIFEDSSGQIFEVLTCLHHRKSQAKAVVRVKLKNLSTSAIVEASYRP
jgi:elongation factor P